MSYSCRRSDCASCAWSLSRAITCRVLTHRPQHLIAVEIEFSGSVRWKERLRNLVDARRRDGSRTVDCYGIGLSLFASADGKLREILTSTGSIPSDLAEAFTRRWPTRMQVIETKELRTAIYSSMKPSVILESTQRRAAARLSIWARRPKFVEPSLSDWDGEALPVIIA